CGKTLSAWLEENNQRDLHQVKSWFKQIVDAVKYIHQNNIMHPSNILIASDNAVKICDLGIATVIDSGKGASKMSRTLIGTPQYSAPEQQFFYNEKVDIFALGLILIELSLVLTDQQKSAIFSAIRSNAPIIILQDQPKTLDLVSKLTKLDKNNRPRIGDILEHPFF
ncbi:hypothetical protein PMAYCL1PPCAC_08842, partial [Pristionchus mayeri]